MNSLNTETKLTFVQSTTAGAVSGILTRGIVAPFDLIKIRLQLKPQKVHTLVGNLIKEEGIRSLWKGNMLAEILHAVYLGSQFAVFKSADNTLEPIVKNTTTRQFLAGGIAGSSASFICYPLDMLRARLAVQTTPVNLKKLAQQMYKEQGIFAFYHGAQMSMLSAFPYMSIFFGVYSLARRHLPKKYEILSAGSLASISAKTLVFPLDTIRRRVQIHGKHATNISKHEVLGSGCYEHSFRKALKQVYKADGILGIYRGLGVSLVKSVPSAFISLYFFEKTVSLMRNKPPSKL